MSRFFERILIDHTIYDAYQRGEFEETSTEPDGSGTGDDRPSSREAPEELFNRCFAFDNPEASKLLEPIDIAELGSYLQFGRSIRTESFQLKVTTIDVDGKPAHISDYLPNRGNLKETDGKLIAFTGLKADGDIENFVASDISDTDQQGHERAVKRAMSNYQKKVSQVTSKRADESAAPFSA